MINTMYEKLANSPSDINEHLPTLMNLATGKIVVEMGVRDVVSTWAFLKGNPAELISYDIYRSPNIDVVTKAARDAGIEFQFIQQSTLECTIGFCDVLFIDTWHTYDQLSRELERHCNSVDERIALHDTVTFAHRSEQTTHQKQTPGSLPVSDSKGLQDAIDEFLSNHSEWEQEIQYTNNNGLTILRRKY